MSTAPFLEVPYRVDRLFAVGDVHGCVKELETLLQHLVKREKITNDDYVVFIGDYIDRGPESRQVIDSLIDFQKSYPESTFFLKGNHEDMFLSYLGFGGRMGMNYLPNGGAETLKSYQFSELSTPQEIVEAMPLEHVEFFKGLHRYLAIENYVFAHAGLSPLRDIRAQIDDDLYWIREEFIYNIHYFQKTIIFGHTPFEDILFHLPYKIGIDTGLVFGSMLSCIELGEEVVYQVKRGGKKVKMSNFAKKGGRWPGM